MRTLITGINGFLAKRLAEHCEGTVFGIARQDNHKTEDKNKPNTFYGDLLDFEFVKRVISEVEPDVIYHLAAQSIVRIANTNPRQCFENNYMSTVNILEGIRQVNPKIKCIVSSTDKSYGEQLNLPYIESMPMQAGDTYGTSKAAADLVAQSYHKTYGLDVMVVRSANIYGGGDMNLSRIIPNTINKILNNQKPIIYSEVMSFKREFVYVDDVCEGYLTITTNGKSGEAYNIGAGEVYRVGDLIEMICDLMGWNGGIDIIEKNFSEIPIQYLSSEKINSIGWKPKVTLNEGLQRTISWYKNKMNK